MSYHTCTCGYDSRRDHPPPTCHFQPMQLEEADTGTGTAVTFWECQVCGHTKHNSFITRSA